MRTIDNDPPCLALVHGSSDPAFIALRMRDERVRLGTQPSALQIVLLGADFDELIAAFDAAEFDREAATAFDASFEEAA